MARQEPVLSRVSGYGPVRRVLIPLAIVVLVTYAALLLLLRLNEPRLLYFPDPGVLAAALCPSWPAGGAGRAASGDGPGW
jgi:hypothetical protein